MDRCSELTSPPRPAANGIFTWTAPLESNRTRPTDASLENGTDHVGFHNRIGFWWDAQPNGSRLSCGALKKDSFPNLRAPSASSAGKMAPCGPSATCRGVNQDEVDPSPG